MAGSVVVPVVTHGPEPRQTEASGLRLGVDEWLRVVVVVEV